MLQHSFYNCIGSFAMMNYFFKVLLYIIGNCHCIFFISFFQFIFHFIHQFITYF